MTGGTIVSAILAVCTAVGEWFISAITLITPMFWADGALTFVGTLTVIGLAIAVIMLVMAMIRSYLRLK